MQTKLTIVIPSYNAEKVIGEAITSALKQQYPLKEVIVVDDCSTDNTVNVAIGLGVKVIVNTKNLGIGGNLTKCFKEAQSRYVLFLCADDVFTGDMVASDVVSIFDARPRIGVIGRYYYQFMDGHAGAVMTVREKNILLSAINPSGMAFRNMEGVAASDRIFIEMPSVVAQYLNSYSWTQLEYDTVAVRLKPSQNTGCNPKYYTEAPIKVLTDFYGKDFKYHLNLIQIKNRAPKLLWREIWLTAKINPRNLVEPLFYLCALTALIVPGSILRHLSNFWRHRINRGRVSIIKRGDNG